MPKWRAFWMLNAYFQQDQAEDPEVNIIEALGDKTNAAHHAYHYRADPDGDGLFNDYNSTELTTVLSDFSENFHTCSVEWSEGLLVYFDEAGAGSMWAENQQKPGHPGSGRD